MVRRDKEKIKYGLEWDFEADTKLYYWKEFDRETKRKLRETQSGINLLEAGGNVQPYNPLIEETIPLLKFSRESPHESKRDFKRWFIRNFLSEKDVGYDPLPDNVYYWKQVGTKYQKGGKDSHRTVTKIRVKNGSIAKIYDKNVRVKVQGARRSTRPARPFAFKDFQKFIKKMRRWKGEDEPIVIN
ncbi:hypothetical protein AKJ56_00330 [candidate division MSBL1 archaeon SCGC-AAA382N08]|uniref:Uncharacterized protein n=1 Tax=candidate division MSBL1 archaeon SCGC-AAA382N08 TaxID=1698285 RepID=A0A133VQL5_9EURY|nr:hypothetical protein AKJ56_00330 [candidate division MSBL1 archaeon SCGC-AAA382N08]